MGRALFRLIVLVATAAVSVSAFAQLPGFQLNGENWTYTDKNGTLSGILIKPQGSGPFPGIVISHGKGGSAIGFGRPKAVEMATWGYVGIAVNYTHAANSGWPASDDGASPENIRRALKCVEILRSLPYVKPRNLGAYGNSMGAFVTIALAAQPEVGLKATAITAGGIAGAPGFPAPTAETARLVGSPMLILHGDQDTTVQPSQSLALKDVLDSIRRTNERVVYPGVGHNLHQVQAPDVYARMKAWFRKFVQLPPRAP